MVSKYLLGLVIAIVAFEHINAQNLPTRAQGCGKSKFRAPRIVGGIPPEPHSFPWLCRAGHCEERRYSTYTERSENWFCGASLISDRFALTASHCILPGTPINTVRLGEHDTTNDNAGKNNDIPVGKVIGHEAYDDKTTMNDIALLLLTRAATEIPICLPTIASTEEQLKPKQMLVAGWGHTSFKGKSPNILQYVTIDYIIKQICSDSYRRSFDSRVLCAGKMEGGKDSCQGDSGGPLMAIDGQGAEAVYVQFGVVSFGKECATKGYPGVYTNVTHYLPWLKQNMASAMKY